MKRPCTKQWLTFLSATSVAFAVDPPPPAPTGGFVIDTNRRNQVAWGWHYIYKGSNDYASKIGWNGAYSSCAPGTITSSYMEDIRRRVNFYRAMAGVSSTTAMNSGSAVAIGANDPYKPEATTTKGIAAQSAALIMSRADAVNHSPPTSYSCWTSEGWNGAARGNLALGLFGAAAIDGYISEMNAGGTIGTPNVGHRRWILRPRASNFATGDVPGDATRRAANCLYVMHRSSEADTTAPLKFVAWPPPGHFPAPLMTAAWSVSFQGADFSQATVTMTQANGSPVSTTLLDRTTTTVGDPAIVWQVPAAVAATSVTQDTVYNVTINNVQNTGGPTSFSYSVRVMNPDVLTESIALSGTNSPPAAGANYTFSKVDLAEAYQMQVSKAAPANWIEGAEDLTSNLILDLTSGNLLQTLLGGWVRTGSKAFRLIFPSTTDTSDQIFELDRDIIPTSTSNLTFYRRRGNLTSTMPVTVEASTDGGGNWQTIGSPITGSGTTDSAYAAVNIPLGSFTNPVRIRFRLKYNGGSFYTAQSASTAGLFIDDISVSNATWLDRKGMQEGNASQNTFTFNATTAGETLTPGSSYHLRARAYLGGHWFSYGPAKLVTISSTPATGFLAWKQYTYPSLAGGFNDDDDKDGVFNGVEYAFGLDPLDGRSSVGGVVTDLPMQQLRLSRSLAVKQADINYNAEWSSDLVTWSTSGVTVDYVNNVLTARVPMGSGARFFRWQIKRPTQ